MYRRRPTEGGIELEIEDESPGALFREGLVALGDHLTEDRGGEPLVHEVALAADDQPQHFQHWLAELERLDREESFVCERAIRLELAGSSLEASVAGQRLGHERVVERIEDARLARDEADGVYRAIVRLRLRGGGG